MLFSLELDTDNSYRALGRLVKFYRMRSGYSLRDLGTLTNVSHTLIANIEQGKIKGSDETLRDLFKVLKLDFADATDVFKEFKHLYDRILDNLFKYEYTRVRLDMKKLLSKEHIYIHSVLITDFGLIKFLHKVLIGEEPKDDNVDISIFRGVQNYFSDRQKQMYLLIEGVNQYNLRMYADAVKYLKSALKVGDSNFDYLIKSYLVKCYVKTYQFMQVIKIGNEAIDFFEDRIIYLRAMEVRLAIANSFMLSQNFEDAKDLLDSVYQFSNNFNAVYLIEEAKLLLALYHMYMNENEMARKYLYSSTLSSSRIFFLKIRVALRNGDSEEARLVYNQFAREVDHQPTKESMMIEIAARESGILEMSEEEFLSKLQEVIKLGEKAQDIEIIDTSYSFLINHYRSKRAYKKALEASSKARKIHRHK